jgi:ABC-2 type transport system ATP-binding protein
MFLELTKERVSKLLKVRDISFSIDGNLILHDINLTVDRYQIVGLVGKNGAGKTTLFNIICGLINFSEGEVTFNDRTPNDVKYFNELFFIPDTMLVHEYLKGIEYIEFVSSLYSKEISNEEIQSMLNYFDLKDNADMLIRDYSKGMKMKIAIIVALLLKPKLIILDEPFNGLDPTSCIKLMDALKYYSEKYGSVLFSSHTLDFVEQISDKIYFLTDKTLREVTDRNLMELFKNE